jgi:hypothetical protein
VDPIATYVLQRDAEFRARSIQNGARLAGILQKAIDERTGNATEKSALVNRLAVACGIPVPKVKELLAGAIDLMPMTWVRGLASVLDLPEHVLSFAVSDDAGDFIRSLEPGRSEVEALVSNAVQSVITNCECQQRADDDGAALLETVLSAAAAAVRG